MTNEKRELPAFPPRLWICWRPESQTLAEAAVGGTDTEGPLMLPPCTNQDLPYWFRAISFDEHSALLANAVAGARARAFEEAAGFCNEAFTLDNVAIAIALNYRAKAARSKSGEK